MLTKNGYALFFGLANKKTNITVKSITGETISLTTSNYNSSSGFQAFDKFSLILSSPGTPAVGGIYFGDGNTAPSVDDYKLSGEFITGLSYYSTNVSMDQADTYIELQSTLAVKNDNSESKTITEIGLFAGSNSKVCLLDRIVLATPITIPAGGTKSITYNLRHTY